MAYRKVPKTCLACGTEFLALPKRKYCSVKCASTQMNKGKRRRHGLAGTREHATWLDMRNRCRNPDAHNYARYGGRGIKVCERWDVFENFLADMGPKPGKGYSIERRDNDGDYEPSNCKWATQLEQSRNRSCTYKPEEDQIIRDCVARGLSFPEMAPVVGKSVGSVMARAYKIGLSSGKPIVKISDRTSQVTSTQSGGASK